MAILNRFVLPALAALTIAALLWLLTDDTVVEPEPEIEDEQQEPDVLASGVSFQQLRPDGQLHYRLNAETIRQYNSDNLTRMNNPDLHLTSENGPPWDIKSRQGNVSQHTDDDGSPEDVVHLSEDVEMIQTHPENGLVVMRSESIYIYPNRQYAESSQNVMIDTEVGRTVAAGMSADLETGVVTLKSNPQQRVHTIVLPEQFKKS